jgi:hypothetical protein
VELPDGTIMMIDVRNARSDPVEADSDFVNPIQYLTNLRDEPRIFRYIQTHPDMDHMDGLQDLATAFRIINFWDTANTKPRPEEFGHGYREEDWNQYTQFHGSDSTKFRLRGITPIGLNGGSFPYSIYVLSPTQALTDEGNRIEDWNLLSYVVLIQYGRFKLLLGGDASDTSWEDIYGWALADTSVRHLIRNITIFKVSHHGATSSYCGSEMLDILGPKEIIISKRSSQDDSAYGSYYNWAGGADHMRLTSQGTILVAYNLQQNTISINQTR